MGEDSQEAAIALQEIGGMKLYEIRLEEREGRQDVKAAIDMEISSCFA